MQLSPWNQCPQGGDIHPITIVKLFSLKDPGISASVSTYPYYLMNIIQQVDNRANMYTYMLMLWTCYMFKLHYEHVAQM